MKPRVYVETSVVSYLTARPARDIVIAGRQQSTRDWWAGAKERLELVISELVREEAAVGDRDAAQSRLAAISPLPVIGTTPEVARLARALVDAKAVPERAAQDAVHISIVAMHRVRFLVTWNSRLHRECRGAATDRGRLSRRRIDPPLLCTPEQLVVAEDDDGT